MNLGTRGLEAKTREVERRSREALARDCSQVPGRTLALAWGAWACSYPCGDPQARGTGNPPSRANIDTSALSAGSGSITLMQSFTIVDMRGLGFQRVDGNVDAVHVVSVTWA
jgi:hypothetical protein